MSDNALIWTIITVILVFIIGVFTGEHIKSNKYKNKAIQHKCAEYNSITGAFQWKDIK